MADFAADTAVHRLGVDGDVTRLRAELSPAWEVWGPVGGYVAAIALRALAAGTELPRPASFHCNFLSVARFGAVDLEVATLRRGKRSHAQAGRSPTWNGSKSMKHLPRLRSPACANWALPKTK